ncbi:2-oxoglutarate and iron-dependent oxygenase domain-containing protein 2 isoform X1 [Procambarus clarkii]|uniref:2-oxoglutarate and iron-dependent oxygenase domain-containing protein 2 isoform X1 n=1 Tax=Procambarus clarkii TaxID=6728 RepID=UPI003742B614
MLRTQFAICKCFFTNNIFIKEYNMHVTYQGREQFLHDYSEVLQSKGCQNLELLLPKLEAESLRRKQLHDNSWKRQLKVAKEYKPMHPQIFTLQPSFLAPRFHEIVKCSQEDKQTLEGITSCIESHQNRIYSFPVFTEEFCQLFLEEIRNFEESPLPKGRPNTMNQYGINLDELGFDSFISNLRTTYITPLTRLLFPDVGGDSLDSHKAFIVTYKEGEDVDLDYHFDNAEVTLNVSLNEDYSDGDLYFGPMRTEISNQRFGYTHKLGKGLLHRGQQLHGALPISDGVRYNLIVWMRSSQVRNELCPMCDEKPILVPVKHGYGDGFIVNTADVCSTF